MGTMNTAPEQNSPARLNKMMRTPSPIGWVVPVDAAQIIATDWLSHHDPVTGNVVDLVMGNTRPL